MVCVGTKLRFLFKSECVAFETLFWLNFTLSSVQKPPLCFLNWFLLGFNSYYIPLELYFVLAFGSDHLTVWALFQFVACHFSVVELLLDGTFPSFCCFFLVGWRALSFYLTVSVAYRLFYFVFICGFLMSFLLHLCMIFVVCFVLSSAIAIGFFCRLCFR